MSTNTTIPIDMISIPFMPAHVLTMSSKGRAVVVEVVPYPSVSNLVKLETHPSDVLRSSGGTCQSLRSLHEHQTTGNCKKFTKEFRNTCRHRWQVKDASKKVTRCFESNSVQVIFFQFFILIFIFFVFFFILFIFFIFQIVLFFCSFSTPSLAEAGFQGLCFQLSPCRGWFSSY